MDIYRAIGISLFAALIIACAPPDHYTVEIKSSHPELIREAFREWEDSVPVYFTEVTDHADITLIDSQLSDLPAGDIGYWESYNNHCFIATNQPEDAFVQTTMHELGHVMGLHHLGPGHLMSTDIAVASKTITSADKAEWKDER